MPVQGPLSFFDLFSGTGLRQKRSLLPSYNSLICDVAKLRKASVASSRSFAKTIGG